MSASQLADRVGELGVPITREAVERIERGERQVRVDELVAFGVALQVPLGVLLFGLGSFEQVGLPGAAAHPGQWQRWLEAQDPSPGVRLKKDPFWKVAAGTVWAHQSLAEWQEKAGRKRAAIETARAAGNADLVATRIGEYLDVLREMAELVQDMASNGDHPPPWHDEFVADAQRLTEGG